MDEALSPRARAIGRFVAFVVNELATVSQSREQYENLKVGVGRLIERIVATGNLSPSAEPGAMIADYWWLRMMNAREPTVEDGVSTPATVEQKALMEIRKTLVPPDAKAATKGQRSRKE